MFDMTSRDYKGSPTTLGGRVKAVRVEKHLTQQQLAKACKIAQPSLSAIEANEVSFLKDSTLLALAAALGVSASWLSTGKGSRDRVGDGEPTLTDEHKLVEGFRRLDANSRFSVLALVMSLGASQKPLRDTKPVAKKTVKK
jgi:transcriptional regulator with XRE-family HTH domain